MACSPHRAIADVFWFRVAAHCGEFHDVATPAAFAAARDSFREGGLWTEGERKIRSTRGTASSREATFQNFPGEIDASPVSLSRIARHGADFCRRPKLRYNFTTDGAGRAVTRTWNFPFEFVVMSLVLHRWCHRVALCGSGVGNCVARFAESIRPPPSRFKTVCI